jgi:hypothetical protein
VKRALILLGLLLVMAVAIMGCKSKADTVSDNVSKEAEQFHVERKIVGINGITDKVLFEVTGRCSIESGDSLPNTLDVICKVGPNTYVKHYLGLSDNVTWVSTQIKASNVDPYHTEVILRPTTIVPDFRLDTP